MEVVKEQTEQKPDNKFVNVVVLQKGANDTFAIVRNKLLMPCPYRQPIVNQRVVNKKKSIETIGMADEPEIVSEKEIFYCNSTCPMFQFSQAKQSNSVMVDLCCGSNHAHYKIDAIIPFVKQVKKEEPTT